MDNNVKETCMKQLVEVFLGLSENDQVEVFVELKQALLTHRKERQTRYLQQSEEYAAEAKVIATGSDQIAGIGNASVLAARVDR